MNQTNHLALKVQHLNLFYGKRHIIKDLNLDLQQGQWLALTGTNGSGKSTLLRAIVGLHPHIGDIQFPGMPIVGYLPQQSLLDFQFPVEVCEFVALGLWKLNIPNKSKMIEAALDKVNALALKNWSLQELSRGQFQKVAIARAIVHQPQLLILDEPLTGLDEDTINDLLKFIQDYKKNGSSGLIVLHDEIRRQQLEIEKLDLTTVKEINQPAPTPQLL